MRKTGSAQHRTSCTPERPVQVLVLSQHDVVRRQLVAYLDRSPSLQVHGDEFSAEAIMQARPDVLVLDLSRLGPTGLQQGLDAARNVGARVIALASIGERSAERAVVEAGGLYRLKSAGADGLADLVHAAVQSPALAGQTIVEAQAAQPRS